MLKKISRFVARAGVQTTILASSLMLCLGVSNPAQAITFDSISATYFFGDSLSDSGWNNTWPGLPAGKAPTFTTFGGYVWAQLVARDVKSFVLPVYPGPNPADTITNDAIYPVPGFNTATLHGVDYAVAGSTTNGSGFNETWAPSLVQQVEYFLTTHSQRPDPNAVYFLWSGANDILTLISGATPPTQLQLLLTAQSAATNIAFEVGRLAQTGAKRIVVVSLPNLGVTPLITNAAVATGNPGLPAQMKTVTFTFNSMLNVALGQVAAKYGTKIMLEDVYDLLDTIILDTQQGLPYVIAGQSFKFVNVTSPACTTVAQAINCPSTAPNGYLFADSLHPTGMAHQIVALKVEQDLLNWS